MSTLREELQRKQQRWMAERERELDRHQAKEALSGLGSKVEDHRVLDRVTSQIAERMQVEMRLQNARAMQDGAVGDRVERLLERHLEAHNIHYSDYGTRFARDWHQIFFLDPAGTIVEVHAVIAHEDAQ